MNDRTDDKTNKTEKASKKIRFKYLWAIIFSISLVLYTTYTMLDAFVIPHDSISASDTEIASIYDTDSDSNDNGSDYGSSDGNDSDESSSDDGHSHKHGFPGSKERGPGRHLGSSSSHSDKREETGSNSSDGSANDSDTDSASDTTTSTITSSSDGDTYTTSSGTVITLKKTYINDTYVYIADVQLNNIADLMSGVADDTFGRNITETTSDIAETVNALLAINGDYYGFRNSGYVMRNGYLYRDTVSSEDAEDFVIYEDGSAEIICEGDISADELKENGALQIYSFGPGLVENGEISVDTNTEVGHSMAENPRTAIGYISPLHYVFVVSDGRTDESSGLTLYQLAEVMQDLGCTEAYNLDGGGSSTMYLDGTVINKPTTNGTSIKEREVSDIVYIRS